MNIKERVFKTYETEDGKVFDTLAEARTHLLKVNSPAILNEGINVDKFTVYLLNMPEDFAAFMQAKNSEGNDNRFLFEFQELQFPMYICERKVIEDGDYFLVYYEYDYLENVIQQQQMVVDNLKFILENPSVVEPEEEEEEEILQMPMPEEGLQGIPQEGDEPVEPEE